MNEIPLLNGVPMSPKMLRLCALIRDGRAACIRGDFAEAERLFHELKRTAPDDAGRNCARLHLAIVYGFQHIPGVCLAESAENLKWIDRAQLEYEEVLNNCPTEDQRVLAESSIAALKGLRQ